MLKKNCEKSDNVYTGLPTKDETSETTVQNLHCLFRYIHDSLQLKASSFLDKSYYKMFKCYI